MKQLEFTEKDLELAQKYLHDGSLLEIQFSGGTYQIQVADCWCFLQLDDEGLISDGFCSCEEENETCSHLAAAWLRIYNGYLHPLHVRFSRSLWNQIGHIFLRKLGSDVTVLEKQEKDFYECFDSTQKSIFSIQLKTESSLTHFLNFMENRKPETEETSLKFSKLSQEEIRLWREGRPTFELRYELSFWSDLAKWLMLLQDKGEAYDIQFSYNENSLPNHLEVTFNQLILKCYLAEADLAEMIPSLITVQSPLKVHSFDEDIIDCVTYDKDLKQFQIHRKEVKWPINDSKSDMKEAYPVEDWLYVKGDGFYPKDKDFLLAQQKIPKEQIPKVLEEHGKLLQRYLVGTVLHREPRNLNYTVSFDEENQLHIYSYVNEPGDLQQPDSYLFDHWVYVCDEGFYRIEEMPFDSVETIIPSKKISDFVSKNRIWLNTQEGFHTHLTSIEAHLIYKVGPDRVLRFFSQTDLLDTFPQSKDFGEWIYVKEEGFYAKHHGRLGLAIQPGVEVKPKEVSLFIRMHQEELEHLQGFFATKNPIKRVGVTIKLKKNNTIVVSPIYELNEGYIISQLQFFDDIVYVEGEGFYFLCFDTRLPQRFREEVKIPKNQISLFLTHEILALQPYIIKIDPKLKTPQRMVIELESLIKENHGTWLAQLSCHTDLGKISVSELLRAKAQGEQFVFSKAGLLDLGSSQFQWLWQIRKNETDIHNDNIKFNSMELMRLQASQELFSKLTGDPQQLWNSLLELKTDETLDYQLLKSKLRSYQETGVKWLWALYVNGLAGLLCDDMGLGKTHQTMALLAAVSLRKEKANYLIVSPTSVIYHWEDKLKQFLPHLRVLTFYGSSRTLHENYDVLLTSYGILRTEQEAISKIAFEVAIFDEVQVAKNHSSLIHKALLRVKAKSRFGLTGTPIENQLREIKALFDVVLPFYMPSEVQFRQQFIIPIEKQHDKEAKLLLSRLIHPFVLRRRKADVLAELPEKTEERFFCDLAPDQLSMYQAALVQAKEKVFSQLHDQSKPIPYMPLFALLTQLKRICDHPAVALSEPQNYEKYQSGKWDLFLELLAEARESGQKIVIFSHYLSMMDIIESYLKKQHIGFASIRGATTNRRDQLERFQNDPTCEIFVGSLQAVGLGIDLTSASIVIHYDRWWNAARENQATDRVHRIGQQRGVQVFKLITKNTIEEHIDRLIKKKGQLMEEIVGSDDENQLKQLDRQEWLELLQQIH